MSLKILPNEIILLILDYCETLSNKDKCIRLLFPNRYNLIYEIKFKWIQKHFDIHIINLLGGINKVIKIPIIPFKKTYQYKMSKLCYIDNIKPYDMDVLVMIGVDYYDRGFVCVKNNNQVDIIFQLFPKHKTTWKHTTCQQDNLANKNNYIINNGKKIKLLYNEFKNYIKHIF